MEVNFTCLKPGGLKLDLCHGYQQVILNDSSQPYVSITTHLLGSYRYTRLSFGVAVAPANFQQIIDKLLEGLT